MLLIACPHCGPGPETESHCGGGAQTPRPDTPRPPGGPRPETGSHWGGEAHIRRPDPASASDADWAAYLFLRRNPRGTCLESWGHGHDCQRWFNASRDTVTDRSLAVYPMGAEAPAAVRERTS